MVIDGTLRDNIDLSGEKTDAEIWTAIEAAQVRIYTLIWPALNCLILCPSQLKDVVGGFEHKLEQPLSARGNELSKGQTQLLALARALLRRNRIVLLDEATGNLDVETDRAVQATIRSAFADCTVLTVAHRIGTIADYDQVAVLEAGRILEAGEPARLLEDEESAFARLSRDATM